MYGNDRMIGLDRSQVVVLRWIEEGKVRSVRLLARSSYEIRLEVFESFQMREKIEAPYGESGGEGIDDGETALITRNRSGYCL